MAQTSVTFLTKINFRVSPVAVPEKMRAEDANELKDVINANSADAESRLTANANLIANNESNITTNAIAIGQNSINLDNHTNDLNNPHVVTKALVGLSEVDNTSDANKPVSDATNLALDAKNDVTAFTAHTGNLNNPHAVTKAQVGLSNVDNTADLDKPVSNLTQAQLNNLDATKKNITASANVRAGISIVSASLGDFWLFRLPNTTQSRMFTVVLQFHRPDDANRFGQSAVFSVALGNTSGLPDRGGSVTQIGGFGQTGISSVFVRFVSGQYYLGFTSGLNGGNVDLAISVHGPNANDVDFSVLNDAASGADLLAVAPLVDNVGRSLLTLASFGYVRTDFDVTTVADNWYRIARLDSGNIWGEGWMITLAFRNGNASQGIVFGVGTTYNNARIGVHTNAIATLLCKSLRVTWAAPNWTIEFQANSAVATLQVWGSIQTARVGVVLTEGSAGAGQVYGNTRTDQQVPTDNTVPTFFTPDVSQGYLAPPINDLGGEQDPPELSSAQAEDFNIEVAEAILTRMENDALAIAYAAEADLALLAGTAYVQGIISTPPDNLIVDRSDYITNGVDPKYL